MGPTRSNVAWAAGLAAIALAGCSEYELGSKPGTGLGTTTVPTTSAPPPTEDCLLEPVPGFEAQLNDDCAVSVAVGSFTPVVEWAMPTFPGPPGDNVMSTPIVVSVTDDDGDGRVDDHDDPDVVFVSYINAWDGGILRAIDGATGAQHWATANAGIEGTGGVAGGDIDSDGFIDLVAIAPNGVVAFEHDGRLKWRNMNLAGAFQNTSDVPAISDMDHDGHPEVIAGRAILNGEDGTLQGMGAFGYGGVFNYNVGSCSFAVDLDADGTEEVITGNAAYNPDGSTKWANGELDGYPAVADLDGDGLGEVVVSGQGELRILDTDGTLVHRVPIPGATLPGYGGPPTIADFDGDGAPEIGVAAGSRYSVIEPDGTVVWQAMTDDASSGNTGSAVFDFEGDGSAEVVYADQTRLWVFSGVDGSVRLSSSEHSNGTWLEYSVVADVDGDGHVEIVVPNEPQYGGHTGITVFGDRDDSWQPGRKIWNQHAYHITNVEDDGGIPVTADLNWRTYNNFRSGDLSSGDGLLAPDLVPSADVCEIDCNEGRIVVYALPGNEGQADVTFAQRAQFELYADVGGVVTLLDTARVTEDLVAGQYLDSVVIDLQGQDPATWDALLVRLVSDALECDDTNNEIRINGPFCE